MRNVFGTKFGFTARGLGRNEHKKFDIRLTDSIGKHFWTTTNICTNDCGELRLDRDQVQGLISQAVNDRSAAFVVHELDEYTIDTFIDDTFYNTITITSGVGEQICKEEWRGDVIGNLFYPNDGNSHKDGVFLDWA